MDISPRTSPQSSPQLSSQPSRAKLSIAKADREKLARISRHTAGRLRRSTLVSLRWMAVTGQAIALLLVSQALGFDVPLIPALGFVSLSVLVNIIVGSAFVLDRRVSDREAALQLGFDLFQLAALLYLTGGMGNPFALLFLAPVVTGATTLSRPVLGILGFMAAGLSLALVFFHLPLPWADEQSITIPFLLTMGAWAALLIGMGFTSLYAWQSASESRRMSEALSATEAVLAQEQKLAALGGLAAAAAHELGTPLATIQVTAKEMSRELPADTPLGDDARLMLSQAQRCREILTQLSRRGDEGDMVHDRMRLEDLMNEVIAPFNIGADLAGLTITLELIGDAPMPEFSRQAELIYGFKNLIENAADFATSKVEVLGTWTSDLVTITIRDDGPGFDPSIRSRLGEPYVSRRNTNHSAGGLGLGVFIAKTLIERTGGTIHFRNVSGHSGAVVELSWPRAALQ